VPRNQRILKKAIAADGPTLPESIPFRAAMSRLSIALERLSKGELESLSDIHSLEEEYLPRIAEIEAAETVVQAMLMRKRLADALGDADAEIVVYDAVMVLISVLRSQAPQQ
jgi:hypothetical protein